MESRSLRRRSPAPAPRGRPRKKPGRPPKVAPPPPKDDDDDDDDDDKPLLECKAVQEKRAARMTRRSNDPSAPHPRRSTRRCSLVTSAPPSDEEDETEATIEAKEKEEEEVMNVDSVPSRDNKNDKVEEDKAIETKEKEPTTANMEESTLLAVKTEKKDESTSDPSLQEEKTDAPPLHDVDLVCQEDESALDYPVMNIPSFRPRPSSVDEVSPAQDAPVENVAIAGADGTNETSSSAATVVAMNETSSTAATATTKTVDTPAVADASSTTSTHEIVILREQEVEVVILSGDSPREKLSVDDDDRLKQQPTKESFEEKLSVDDDDPLKQQATKESFETEPMDPRSNVGQQAVAEETPTVSTIGPLRMDDAEPQGDEEKLLATETIQVAANAKLPESEKEEEEKILLEESDSRTLANEPIADDTTENVAAGLPDPDEPTPMEIETSDAVVPFESQSSVDPPSSSPTDPLPEAKEPTEPLAKVIPEDIATEGMDESAICEPPPEEPRDTAMDLEDNTVVLVAGAVSDPSSDPSESLFDISASTAPEEVPMEVEATKKRAMEASVVAAKRKRLRAMSSYAEPVPTVSIRRISIVKTKLCIYTAGRRAHGAPSNYDQMFGEYWNVLSRRLEGNMTAECPMILNAFLKTKGMRKLHNQLILELMQRCLKTTAPTSDISYVLPRHLRDRISKVTPKAAQLKRVVTEEMDERIATADMPSEGKKLKLSYGPSILTESYDRHPPVPDNLSTRISGALIIDPHVRKLADSAGMKVSEHAVWLMVVAVKEFSQALLKKTICTMNAVESGRVPPRLTRSFAGSQSTWITEDDNVMMPNVRVGALKCITSAHMHTVIANLPTSSRSLSGWVSRSVLERSLNASLSSSLVVGGNAFDDVKKYIISSISPPNNSTRVETPTLPIQVIHSGMNHGDLELLKGRKSPLMRGLGRGAKDLATLKARATTIKADNDAPKITDHSEGAIATAVSAKSADATSLLSHEPPIFQDHSSRNASSAINKPSDEVLTLEVIPNSGEGSTLALSSTGSCSILDHASGSSTSIDQRSMAARRGKGHGVKNLAMMRARSVTSSTDLAGDMAAAAASAVLSDSNEERSKDVPNASTAVPLAAIHDETKAEVKTDADADGTHEQSTEVSTVASSGTSALSKNEPALADSQSIAILESSTTIDHLTSQNPGATVVTDKCESEDQSILAPESTTSVSSSKVLSSSTIPVVQPQTGSAGATTSAIEPLAGPDSQATVSIDSAVDTSTIGSTVIETKESQ